MDEEWLELLERIDDLVEEVDERLMWDPEGLTVSDADRERIDMVRRLTRCVP